MGNHSKQGFPVKNHSKTTQPVPTSFNKPTKDRILEAADKVFRFHGVHAGIGAIAYNAQTNSDAVTNHFAYRERLVAIFVKTLIKEAKQCWADVTAEGPTQPVRILSFWAFYEEGRQDERFRCEVLLARSAAELARDYPKNPLLVEIEQYWQAERDRVVELCEAAGLREPRDLADRLLLLVHGARNERGAFGHHAPSRMLHQIANDLLVSHGADRELLFQLDDD
jgi:AcrR family transcriptional regulator